MPHDAASKKVLVLSGTKLSSDNVGIPLRLSRGHTDLTRVVSPNEAISASRAQFSRRSTVAMVDRPELPLSLPAPKTIQFSHQSAPSTSSDKGKKVKKIPPPVIKTKMTNAAFSKLSRVMQKKATKNHWFSDTQGCFHTNDGTNLGSVALQAKSIARAAVTPNYTNIVAATLIRSNIRIIYIDTAQNQTYPDAYRAYVEYNAALADREARLRFRVLVADNAAAQNLYDPIPIDGWLMQLTNPLLKFGHKEPQ